MGASKNNNAAFSGISDRDLTGRQYCLIVVQSGTNNHIDVCSVAGAVPIFGVLQNKPNSGEHAAVDFMGITKAQAGAAVRAGDIIGSSATGYSVAVGSLNFAIGYAITGCASGGIFTLMIDRCYL